MDDRYNEADLKIDYLQTADFLRVFSAAEPPESVASNVKMLFVVGLTGSLGTAVLLAFLYEYMDSTLHGAPQIEAVAQGSALGKISTANNQQVITFCGESSPQKEAVQVVCQKLANVDTRHICIVVNRARLDSSYQWFRKQAEPTEALSELEPGHLSNPVRNSNRRLLKNTHL